MNLELAAPAYALEASTVESSLEASPLEASTVDQQAPTPSRPPLDRHPRLRLSWLVLQAIPSPGIAVGDRGAHGSLSWQVTPLLYSWALDPRLSRFRTFVVEPLVRQAGSIELFVSPEWVGRGLDWTNLGFRAGARAYFPITERGDGLSWSLGASLAWFDDAQSPSLDVGIYTLFGGLGLLASATPWFADGWAQLSLRVRYF
ncbi:MAG TPA: hypothetical protein VLC09_09415 [Polyangiaceae bacterium]|nr:hypothetical protein [Polyangiaceae bacterium]